MLDNDIQITYFEDFVGKMTNVYRRTEVMSERIMHSEDAYRFVYPYFDDIMDDHEEFKVIHMNNAGFVVNVHHATKGTDNATLVSTKDIFRQIILCKTTSIICVHNHPSGNVRPSKGDRDVTKKIRSAAKLFDITLMDHMVITRESYFSFANEGIL